MSSRFHQNSVLHGCLDFFCLACEAMLRTEKDVNTHIDSSVHKKNLEEANYVESCLEDHIRKVNKGYYCDYCNVLLTNKLKMKLHIKKETHKLNKKNELEGETEENILLKRVENAVIAFEDLMINESAWNGIIDNTCMICGDEFEDEEIHKNGTEHLLKLIQAKVQVGSEKNIYRIIDESTYQCLTCNTVISPKDMVTHFENTEHTKLHAQCHKAKLPVIDENHNKTDIKRPEEAKNADAEKSEKSEASVEVTASDNNKDIVEFTKQNQITYNRNHSFAYCRICEKKIPSSMKSMQEHVNGNPHQLKNKPKITVDEAPVPPLYKTKPMEEYISTVNYIDTILNYDTVINDKICISVFSLGMITVIDGRLVRCQACEQTMTMSEIENHDRTREHDRALKCAPVLYTLDSEFVREVRPGIFHCGFCNLIDAGYDRLQQHLRSNSHRINKEDAEWCLQRWLPLIIIDRLGEMINI